MRNERTNNDFETACPRCGERMLVLTKTEWRDLGTTRVGEGEEASVLQLVTEASSGVHVCTTRELRRMLIVAETFADAEEFVSVNDDLPGWDVRVVLYGANPDSVRGQQYHAAAVLSGSPIVTRLTEEVAFSVRLGDNPTMLFVDPVDVIELD